MINKKIQTPHGTIQTPAFLPDATYGSIKTLSFEDVKKTGTKEIVTTTLHLEQKLGSKYIKKFGGVHKFFGWDRPILTDSGGYQVFSLIYRTENPNNVISDAGCSFINFETNETTFLSPEISMQVQFNLGGDIMTVLDVPLRNDDTHRNQVDAIERNTRWARRSKDEFLKLHNLTENDFNNPKVDRPLLGCVIQGGNNKDLRKQSTEELVEIGFDLYNYGGGTPNTNTDTWLVDVNTTQLEHDVLEYTASLIPQDKVRYAMGIGTPDDIANAYKAGWDIFDTVLPTRNARHGYLYVSKGQGDKVSPLTRGARVVSKKDQGEFKNYSVLHIKRKEYEFSDEPVDKNCDCECCTTTSRAYLRYLIRIGELAGQRLATIHNLRFYQKIIKKLN